VLDLDETLVHCNVVPPDVAGVGDINFVFTFNGELARVRRAPARGRAT